MIDRHPIRCACGAVEGEIANPPWTNHVVCYCASCQAFPARLGRAGDVLDEHGGTDIVQTSPAAVTFSRGQEHLACLRVTPKGPLRWYAACCNTPIGNTPANPKFAFVGLLHSCLGSHEALDREFGPVRMRFFTGDATGAPKPEGKVPVWGMLGFAGRMLGAWVGGGYRRTPFFNARGEPVAEPEDR